MIEAAFSQLRFALSLALGTRISTRSLDRLVAALRETRREFGASALQKDALLDGPVLTDETRQQVQWQRFRAQARKAARETAYYKALFQQLGIEPERLRPVDLSQIPLTPKSAIRDDPDAFVCQSARPYLRATTTGTTGKPTSVYFSQYELQVYSALTAMAALFSGEITEEDIVQISTTARGTLGNVSVAGACAHLGAITYLVGVVEPEHSLALLAEKRNLPGKKSGTSILYTYPSYLGQLVEQGIASGYRPADFALERIIVGGELVTRGLRERCKQLFGEVAISSGYGMTEIWPFGGQLCEENHLHFEASHGLLEVYNPQTATLAKPGEFGTLVATPFPPYRETTLVLRFNTEDMVQALPTRPACRLRHMPATGPILGKRRYAVQHEQGWTFQRQVAEALEAVEVVPLPARYGFWATGDDKGVEVEVLVPHVTTEIRRKIATSLEEWEVPLRALHLTTQKRDLRQPCPLRGDLREQMFEHIATLTQQHMISADASLLPIYQHH
jgi:phenylacetate-coenzyme A ligase PaaK-like adenylate-forming protein